MFELHARLGELLVVVYLGIAIAALVLARRRSLPAWVTGAAHALLAVQVITGLVLFIRFPDVMPLSHIIVGLLTVPALALIVPLRRWLGGPKALAVTALTVAILAAIATVIGVTR